MRNFGSPNVGTLDYNKRKLATIVNLISTKTKKLL
jgi:hypothetical protein